MVSTTAVLMVLISTGIGYAAKYGTDAIADWWKKRKAAKAAAKPKA